jgi:hypothetical protein
MHGKKWWKIMTIYSKEMKRTRSSVAAWLSETVLRGRGPGASGFESHRRGRIFSKEGTSAGPWIGESTPEPHKKKEKNKPTAKGT